MQVIDWHLDRRGGFARARSIPAELFAITPSAAGAAAPEVCVWIQQPDPANEGSRRMCLCFPAADAERMIRDLPEALAKARYLARPGGAS